MTQPKKKPGKKSTTTSTRTKAARKTTEPDLILEKMIGCNLALGDVTRAEADLQRLLEIDPWSSRAHFLSARIHHHRNENEEALGRADLARFLDPWNEESMMLEHELSEREWSIRDDPASQEVSLEDHVSLRMGKNGSFAAMSVEGGPGTSLLCVDGAHIWEPGFRGPR